ncbi:hypothetical protein RFI_31241 [Reticulomyxa filosa]|uniref:Kelch motif family protein n=1 Tax=Reticulomyxa filosa TaxID=46433 RepID=X6LZJ0_RETFI|nr:hypothetical protein RFI_31241 [Reticulomyxa filosa]|eukprot:ETO06155.1 hypothetical protein RFI_31241 [Reticulomyxa filosa]
MSNQIFQSLKKLPTPFSQTQCVLHKHEILICGGYKQRNCYSYHTIKNEYKFICEYPRDVYLERHCVVKLMDNSSNKNDQITLLSFGGRSKHTLVMKYVSIWNNDNEINKSKRSKKSKKFNQWKPFTDNNNHPIILGRDGDYYEGVRAVIGGSNNHLLFIAYLFSNISVFDLNKFQFIKHDQLPTHSSQCNCFISRSENRQEMKTNEEKDNSKKKKKIEMLSFYTFTGFSIEYNEDNNTFRFCQLTFCNDVELFCRYAYVRINDIILLFGGYDRGSVNSIVHSYSISENTWIKLEYTLPIPSCDCFGILNEDKTYIHIIGGNNNKMIPLSTHMKTKVNALRNSSQLVIFISIFFFVIKHKSILLYKTDEQTINRQ